LAAEATGNVAASQSKVVIGWREWIRFPDFSGVRVRAKIDTGARTSALHAANIKVFEQDGRPMVSFDMFPRARSTETIVPCMAPLIARRRIRNSGGQETFRYIIETNIEIGGDVWPIEISLTQRDRLQLRMLLGRTALGGRYLVDPVNCHLLGK
jgi:hypothetical protein